MAIAVGDIHGCLEPLQRLIAKLPLGEELVFLGDYIDRGPDSLGVVDFLTNLAVGRPCRFLLGNHEELMRQAIEESANMPAWLLNGGTATLASYGVSPAQMEQAAVRDAFLGGHREFFSRLPRYYEDDDTIFVHAGVDPTVPDMERQSPEVLIWIREKFFRRAELWEGKQIIFGHTPMHNMPGLSAGEIFRAGRIRGIDTGCVYGGFLTALDSKTQTVYQATGVSRRGNVF